MQTLTDTEAEAITATPIPRTNKYGFCWDDVIFPGSVIRFTAEEIEEDEDDRNRHRIRTNCHTQARYRGLKAAVRDKGDQGLVVWFLKK